MISPDVEISITRGAEDMVPGYLFVVFLFFSFLLFCNHAFLVFLYTNIMQRYL